MRFVGLLAVAVSIVVYNSVTDAGLLDLSEEAELQRYRFRVKILHERLIGKLKQLNLQIQQINLFVVSVAPTSLHQGVRWLVPCLIIVNQVHACCIDVLTRSTHIKILLLL